VLEIFLIIRINFYHTEKYGGEQCEIH